MADFQKAPRDVAIVSVTQDPHSRAVVERNEVELIQPIIQRALEQIGVQKGEIDFLKTYVTKARETVRPSLDPTQVQSLREFAEGR